MEGLRNPYLVGMGSFFFFSKGWNSCYSEKDDYLISSLRLITRFEATKFYPLEVTELGSCSSKPSHTNLLPTFQKWNDRKRGQE